MYTYSLITFANNFVCIFSMYENLSFFLVEEDELFWKLSCVALEKQISLWKKKDSMEKITPCSLNTTRFDHFHINMKMIGTISAVGDCFKISGTRYTSPKRYFH